MHVPMECVKDDISKLSSDLFNKIDKISTQFKMLSTEQQFIYMLQVVEEDMTIYLAFYLRKVYMLFKH